jgi:S-adenosylmethionine:tRNA ribosyltransferase-isomerase
MCNINISDYEYDLPSERIAQYPVKKRDKSKLLVFNEGEILKDIFSKIDEYLPHNSLLVFNNSRVIRARILFSKPTGASIEIFCLEPLSPSEYEYAFSSGGPVEWKCIIGNLKKWKNGILSTSFINKDHKYILTAEKIQMEADAWRIRFSWNCFDLNFGEVIEAIGHIPLPPYITREDEIEDINRYQTVYSSIKGSVAAPTAGLHFTETVLNNLNKKGINSVELTLHIGAGTFKPVKSKNIYDHEMHCEHFLITENTIKSLINNLDRIIAVGTTSVRTLESLYWIGVKILKNPSASNPELSLGQWEAYEMDSAVTVINSMGAILIYLKKRDLSCLHASTNILIKPGYKFKMINGLITNFHQPRSTLLLLISAWTGGNWKDIYEYALKNEFRFLSYGDSSLLLS